MRLATASVGLVSPRSTWLSIGALTRPSARRGRAATGPSPRAARGHGGRCGSCARARRSGHADTSVRYRIHDGSRHNPRLGLPLRPPDVLVLAGGGVVGEAWMTGVLAGIEEESGADLRAVESLVGHLGRVDRRRAPGRRQSPRRRHARAGPARRREPQPAAALVRGALRRSAAGAGRPPLPWPCPRRRSRPRPARWRARPRCARAPVQRPAARRARPRGRRLRRALRRAPARLRRGQAHGQARRLRRPGRAARERRPGRGGVVRDPWVFAPVTIGGREYVDGGAWSRHEPRRGARAPRHAGALPGPDGRAQRRAVRRLPGRRRRRAAAAARPRRARAPRGSRRRPRSRRWARTSWPAAPSARRWRPASPRAARSGPSAPSASGSRART